MNITQVVHDGLLEVFGGSTEVFLEDVIRIGCGYRHHLRMDGVVGKPDRAQNIFLKEVEIAWRDKVCEYLKGCYGDRFRRTGYRTHEGVTVLTDGVLDKDLLVDIQVISKTIWNDTKPPRSAVLTAATKAHIEGYRKVLLIVCNRDNQDWTFWRITGNYAKAAEPILKDIGWIHGLSTGKSKPVGMASPATCMRCPYKEVCVVEKVGDPQMFSADVLKAHPAMEQMSEIEGYLWSLNQKPNHRSKKCIHPSSFSTSKCDREIAYDLLGIEEQEKISPKLRRIFDTGHCVHDVVQHVLEAKLPDFEPEVRAIHEDLKIRGSCDGQQVSVRLGYEFKSIGSKGYLKLTKAKPEHEKQATIYATALDLDQVVYIYINKENAEIAAFTVRVNKTLWHKLATRAANIIKTVDSGGMPPRIDKSYICEKCKYAWKCKPAMTKSQQQKRKFR